MEESIDEMKERHKKEIEKLQENCTHQQLSDWLEEWGIFAHPTGFETKTCKVCGKIVKRRVECKGCGKVTENYIEGDGRTWDLAISTYWCRDCFNSRDTEEEREKAREFQELITDSVSRLESER